MTQVIGLASGSTQPQPAGSTPLGAAPFVGRRPELAVISQQLSEAAKGSARVVLISGEPGIGKSRLVCELTRNAAAEGARVLQGRCLDLAHLPHSALVDALR